MMIMLVTVQRQVLASGKSAVGGRQDAHATAGEGHGEAVEKISMKNSWLDMSDGV